MPTVSRGLPEQPHLDVPKQEARELLERWRKKERDALERIRQRHPKLKDLGDDAIVAAALKLSDAQLVIAREYGFSNWAALKKRIAAHSAAGALRSAIHAGDRERVIAILREAPEMLHLPVWSGNWGPPMSHAANLGQLEIVQACAELGARDFQHAFDRAILQGRIECARWLHSQGAKVMPGIIMGSCETLNAAGFKFLLELGAPLTDGQGNRFAPLALVLETYSRNTVGKHAILEMFAERGYELPDTPTMALHRGGVERLNEHLRRDSKLLERRFPLHEIYLPECGCADEGRSGLHWTPIAGTTLLHLAVDFREREILEWLLDRGADVNARGTLDGDGFGGHTPLFNAVVNGPERDAATARALLVHGAARDVGANLRKFLDWCETPRWHVAQNVTPAEWARGFPETGWVNSEAMRILE
jgi:hypothetical protein